MLKSKTVFVIGAGASAEAGLPIGEELTKQIAELVDIRFDDWGDRILSGDTHLIEALRSYRGEGGQQFAARVRAAGWEMAEAMHLVQSIDTYLETHSDASHVVTMGKLGIVRAIAIAEANSKLASPRGEPLELKKLGGTWYRSLARLLFNGVPANQPERALQDANFIVFNYDRCLERFLLRALEVNFRIEPSVAEAILGNAVIYHPYGSLGPMLPGRGQNSVGFGSDRCDLFQVSERIQTYSEQVLDRELLNSLRSLIETADKIVFLGFAFHDQNMALISPENLIAAKLRQTRVFATTYGSSDSDTAIIRDQIVGMLKNRPEGAGDSQWLVTHNGTCADLFSQYWRSLSA